MNKNKIASWAFFSLLILITLYSYKNANAYDDQDTHPKITDSAIENSNINSYLINSLNYKDGIKTTFPSNSQTTIKILLQKGSIAEDSPNCRASNHFHNPLKPWNSSAMSDEPLWLDVVCLGWKPWYSNIVWATGQQSPTGPVISRNKQDMGWDNARNYFYSALTSASASDRETNFTKTFQAVGQVMHLLQDMAVPAHVRNDFRSHLTFNKVTSMNPIRWYGNPFEFYVKDHPEMISSASIISPSFSNPRLPDFWDTDGQSAGSLGLAEITNAGFFSDSTIPNNNPTPEHAFLSPQIRIDSNSQYLCTDSLPGSNKPTKYVSRKQCLAGGRSADHFAALSLINSKEETAINNPQIKEVWLDDNVHNTYAQDLLPRAVGYSSGLLNYFFRGDISMRPGGEVANQYVIENNSTEDMAGTFELYYDDTNDQRKPITLTWETSQAIVNIPTVSSKPVTFIAPADAKEKNKYILVFRGKLGNEENAVAGRVVKFWSEEWDNGLKGNHTWLFSGIDINVLSTTQIENIVDEGKLTKNNSTTVYDDSSLNENFIEPSLFKAPVPVPYPTPAGYESSCTDPNPGPRYCLDSACWSCFPYEVGKEFPLTINKDTRLSLKIDEMTQNVPASCPGRTEGAYQGIVFQFYIGPDGPDRKMVEVNFTLPGNETASVHKNVPVPEGENYSVNIYNLLSPLVKIVEPVKVYEVKTIQWIYCGSWGTTYQQHMEVDYIRLGPIQ